ncbi:hypothetical protein D3C80_1733830 [compost metagenome]
MFAGLGTIQGKVYGPNLAVTLRLHPLVIAPELLVLIAGVDLVLNDYRLTRLVVDQDVDVLILNLDNHVLNVEVLDAQPFQQQTEQHCSLMVGSAWVEQEGEKT